MSLRSLSSLGRRNAVISGEGKLYFVFPRIVPAIFFYKLDFRIYLLKYR